MTIREARIILPVMDNDGNNLEGVHDMLAHALCDTFGGYTVTECHGAWKDAQGKRYEDAGRAYDVAMDDTAANADRLADIAHAIGRKARQEAMYVRYASGDVVILDTRETREAVAA